MEGINTFITNKKYSRLPLSNNDVFIFLGSVLPYVQFCAYSAYL